MQSLDNNTRAFLALVRAGLWETEARLLPYEVIDYNEVFRLAQEQTVEGLVAAGLEHVVDTSIPKEIALSYAGIILQYEKLNLAMNQFIAHLFSILDQGGILALLVKGQGVAQCYERPLWRACGDVDVLLDESNYHRAVELLTHYSSHMDEEMTDRLHQAMKIDNWEVELHGTMRNELWNCMDRVIDEVQNEVFSNNHYRQWQNNIVSINIPAPDYDVLFVFTHIIQHYYNGGIGLRQICDWCRLLSSFKHKIHPDYLERKLRSSHLMNEWRSFAALAVEYLGIPEGAVPMYCSSKKWSRNARSILSYVLKVGNFGHNREGLYYTRKPFILRKFISFEWHTLDITQHFYSFPLNSLVVWGRMFTQGIWCAIKGQG